MVTHRTFVCDIDLQLQSSQAKVSPGHRSTWTPRSPCHARRGPPCDGARLTDHRLVQLDQHSRFAILLLCNFTEEKKEQVLSFFSVPEPFSEFTECWTSIHGTDPPWQWRFYWQFQHGNLPHTLKQVEMKEPAGSKTVLFIPNVRTNNKQSPPLLETTRPRASVDKDWVLQCKPHQKSFGISCNPFLF